jgi:hypothetical protein
MGNQHAALEWLQQAITLGGKREIKKVALQDEDLQPLWGRIGGL